MRSIRWVSLVLALTACSAKGGTGFSGTNPDPDSSTPEDSSAQPDGGTTPDGSELPDVPASPDGTALDMPTQPDVVQPDVVLPDVPGVPDVPAVPDVPEQPDVIRMDTGPSCGDGVCNGEESCSSCARDCGSCPPPTDVPVELFCGDRTCSASRGENCTTCSADCGPCPVDVPPTDPCALLPTCSTCAASAATGCGWCSNAGRCAMGTSTGPTTAVSGCSSTAGTWVRSTTSCGGTGTGVTATCTTASAGTARDCGWRTSGTFTCTPGRVITVGCNSTADSTNPLCASTIGSCVGDPVLRVCPGSTPCTSATALVPSAGDADDECSTCPLVQVTCPTSGQINVLTGDYNTSSTSTQHGTCSPSVR